MTGRERLQAIFAGELVDRVPFALKGWRIPQCEAELQLRVNGMCILDARSVHTASSPNVQRQERPCPEAGTGAVRTVIQTPRGQLTAVRRPSGGPRTESTSWHVERLFKGPEDYVRLRAMVEDRRYAPAYEGFLRAEQEIGSEAYFKTGAPGCPLHDIIYSMMGIDAFAAEWAERRDEVEALAAAMAANQRPLYEIVARSPAPLVQIGGNYAPEVLGMQRFLDHVLPHWDEACALLHGGGKLVGCHLDANNGLWADEVGAAPLDWLEAFTPAPDTDMTMAAARVAWPDKTLFINFPSSVHLADTGTVAATTRQLLREAAPGDRFVIGITENVPDNRWRESFATILRVCNEYGRLPLDAAAI